MKRLMGVVGLAFAVAASTVATVTAQGAAGADLASAQRYIQANYTLVKGATAKIGPAEAALRNLAHQVRSECPQAAANSPQDHDSEQLSYEVIGAMVIAAYHPGVQLGVSFVQATQGLRFGNRALASEIQSYVGKIRVLTRLAAPNVCADVRAWVASGYAALPAATVSFDRQFIPNWVAIGELPLPLSRYEGGAVAGIVRQSRRFENQLTEVEAHIGVDIYEQIMNTLVLPP